MPVYPGAPVVPRTRPANTLSDIVGADGLQRLARRAGMRHFVAVMGVWGRSPITPSDQARFFQRIDRLLPCRHRVHAMVLLRTIVASGVRIPPADRGPFSPGSDSTSPNE